MYKFIEGFVNAKKWSWEAHPWARDPVNYLIEEFCQLNRRKIIGAQVC